jgi:hypothetical protein
VADDEFDLATLASDFALETQGVLRAVLPGDHSVVAQRLDNRYVVKPVGDKGSVDLLHDDVCIGHLRISVFCTVDSHNRYLAVDRSTHVLYWKGERNPLLRLDFSRAMHTAPACHWQIHAERGAFSAMLGHAGASNPHSIASLHLPVGGGRMRPCLEDMLEFLVRDCGVQAKVGWEDAIREGRQLWRERQVGALVRDAPDVAIRVLEEHGYSVTPPADGPGLTTNVTSLQRP